MDTDDIARKDRFEKQLAEFNKDPELDICGSSIYEFEGEVSNIVAKRTVPLTDKKDQTLSEKAGCIESCDGDV